MLKETSKYTEVTAIITEGANFNLMLAGNIIEFWILKETACLTLTLREHLHDGNGEIRTAVNTFDIIIRTYI